jgi:hypothetical protein
MLRAMVEGSPIAIDLTERERSFIADGLREWQGSAGWTPLPIEALGLSNWDEFDALTDRLRDAVTRGEPLTDLDWARVLFLSEITWASCLVGAALDFEIVTGFSDAEAVAVLRSLQRKIGNSRRADLLFPGRGRPRPVEDWKRETERMLQEIRGRKYPGE